jgi:hypothetical protein
MNFDMADYRTVAESSQVATRAGVGPFEIPFPARRLILNKMDRSRRIAFRFRSVREPLDANGKTQRFDARAVCPRAQSKAWRERNNPGPRPPKTTMPH